MNRKSKKRYRRKRTQKRRKLYGGINSSLKQKIKKNIKAAAHKRRLNTVRHRFSLGPKYEDGPDLQRKLDLDRARSIKNSVNKHIGSKTRRLSPLKPIHESSIKKKTVDEAVKARLVKNEPKTKALFELAIAEAQLINNKKLSATERNGLKYQIKEFIGKVGDGDDRLPNFARRVGRDFKQSVDSRKFRKPLKRTSSYFKYDHHIRDDAFNQDNESELRRKIFHDSKSPKIVDQNDIQLPEKSPDYFGKPIVDAVSKLFSR